jgi:sphinganine-1-phosphate aldolase
MTENGLGLRVFPSLHRMESDVAMVAGLLGGDASVAGSMTSGGTESIFLAAHTAREWARRQRLAAGLARIAGLHIWGEPDLWAVAYSSEDCDIHAVADAMTARRWSVGRVRKPPGIHLMLTPVHAPIVDDYLADLAATVATVRGGAGTPSRTPVVY